MKKAMAAILSSLASRNNVEEGDYLDTEGFLMCGRCNTRKQTEVDLSEWDIDIRNVAIMCECEEAEYLRKEAERKHQDFLLRVEQLRKTGLTDPAYYGWTFENDDRRYPKISDGCRKYVEEWKIMKKNNVGLLFFGSVGVGKSYYACCIANALLNKGVSVLVTSVPRVLNKLQSDGWNNNNDDILSQFHRYELIVLDDLGTERDTSYAKELLYSVIDTRYRSGKPLIVTTNLDKGEMLKPKDFEYKRIYDRILQNCQPIRMNGASRRAEMATVRREKFGEYLGFGGEAND